MLRTKDLLSIGEIARRSGLAPSALRHYEAVGLIAAHRTQGNRRRYERATLRRIAVIRAGQRVGLTLEQIRHSFRGLDPHRAPTRSQWQRISEQWQPLLEQRIQHLQQVQSSLAECVGCGCLSMRQCTLHNPQDALGHAGGTGPQRLLRED